MSLKNKVILVTGSTTGIGEAVVKRCLQEGAKIMLHGRDEVRAAELCQQLGKNTHYIIADLADANNCPHIVKATLDAFGDLDCVVNNAALTTRSNISNSDAELFDLLVGVNLRAPLLLTRAAVEHFRAKKKPGTIVNIGSINAYCGQPDLLVYSISKGGLMTMTRNLGDALGAEKIRINQLNVGWTVTQNEIALKKKEGLSDDWMTKVPSAFAPSGKLLAPEEVAEHVLFLLSDRSGPISGCVYDLEQYPVIGRNRIGDFRS